jgi:hypothetical protein
MSNAAQLSWTDVPGASDYYVFKSTATNKIGKSFFTV